MLVPAAVQLSPGTVTSMTDSGRICTRMGLRGPGGFCAAKGSIRASTHAKMVNVFKNSPFLATASPLRRERIGRGESHRDFALSPHPNRARGAHPWRRKLLDCRG